MQTRFNNIPRASAAFAEHTPADPLGFYEWIALNGYECRYVRIPAAAQRHFFGNTPFGRRAVRVAGSTCTTIRSCAFGRDFDTQSAYWSQFDRAWRSCSDDRILSRFPL